MFDQREYLYTHGCLVSRMAAGAIESQLAVTFYKPTDYFDGLFNRFVSWMTSGQFCHCELVVKATPKQILECVKHIYNDANPVQEQADVNSAQSEKYHPEDCTRIVSQIETHFFNNQTFRTAIQTSEYIHLSFSLLWGNPMTVRILNETSHDSWFRVPCDDTPNVVMKKLDYDDEAVQKTLRFALEELGKNYDTTSAILSVIPWHSSQHPARCDSYFCSEFVVMALQRLGGLAGVDAKHTTPNALFQKLATERI